MTRRAWLIGCSLIVLLVGPTVQAQHLNVQERERLFHERASLLRSQIQPGWSPEAVAAIMGPPDVVGQRSDGAEVVETWWYHGYQVGIEFRNGGASTWFFRFMR